MKNYSLFLMLFISQFIFSQNDINIEGFNQNNARNYCAYINYIVEYGDDYEGEYFSNKAYDELMMANERMFYKLKSKGISIDEINTIMEYSYETPPCNSKYLLAYNADELSPSKYYGKVIEISEKIYNQKLNVFSQIKNSDKAYPYKEAYMTKTSHPASTNDFIYRLLYKSIDNKFYEFKFLWNDNINDLLISKVETYFAESGGGDWDSESFFWIEGWSGKNSSDIVFNLSNLNEKQFVIEINDFFKLFNKIFPQKEYDNYVKSRKTWIYLYRVMGKVIYRKKCKCKITLLTYKFCYLLLSKRSK